ncbi:MAG TPA: hypothetical protein VJ809_00405, partial [Pirellulales bacterium]|nr:hypothetical protein [Pirellulales bacterium]
MTQNQSRREIAAERHFSMSRRRFLRGVGACLALPAFESLMPSAVNAAAPAATAGVSPGGAPVRMAFVYFPNGAHQANWWP